MKVWGIWPAASLTFSTLKCMLAKWIGEVNMFCKLSFCIEIYSFPFLLRIKEWWCSPSLKSPIKPKWCAQYIMRTKWTFQNHWQLCISVKLSFITQSSLKQKPSHKAPLQKYILEALLKSFQKNIVKNALLKLHNYDLLDKYFFDKYQKLQLLLYVGIVINPDFRYFQILMHIVQHQ